MNFRFCSKEKWVFSEQKGVERRETCFMTRIAISIELDYVYVNNILNILYVNRKYPYKNCKRHFFFSHRGKYFFILKAIMFLYFHCCSRRYLCIKILYVLHVNRKYLYKKLRNAFFLAEERYFLIYNSIIVLLIFLKIFFLFKILCKYCYFKERKLFFYSIFSSI